MLEAPSEAIVVPFRTRRGSAIVATEVRSTLITASIEALRKTGRFDEYFKRLAPEFRESIVFGVAGLWLPMTTALAHYAAIDALALSEGETVANGRSAGGSLNNTFLRVMVKLAGHTGTTPWFSLGQAGKLFERVFQGGDVQVEKLGPQEARIDVVALPLMTSPYFRRAMRGHIQAGCELFCHRAYVREIETSVEPEAGSVRVSWV